MNNLVIDIGNTFTKIAVFNGDSMINFAKAEDINAPDYNAICQKYNIDKIIVSSVTDKTTQKLSALAKKKEILFFNSLTTSPIHNHYQSPKTLGNDRMAAVVGAKKLFPENPVLVIDAGTCITYDYADAQSNYYGGSISLGLNMRLIALHKQTKKLPLVTFDNNFDAMYGANTTQSILSGVINGTIAEVTQFINHYFRLYADVKIILCGGDAAFFDTRLKNSIFAHQIICEPHLVLIGLNKLLNYQHD
ncbi:MAG: type III pantothenate kinase [Sphingobacteriales bacterium]|nr:MAG: type III pantothenate kinase [Sphingobacteriales bacterium]TAF80594.1 MAG: type III pantothenate kinase [Sphingobacteriales bacterium]